MIDLRKYGFIKIHKGFTKRGDDVIQFFPGGNTYADRRDNMKSMIVMMDNALKERNVERGIIIRSHSDYPTPCTIIFDYAMY